MTKQILLYAIPKGETERYTEGLLATNCTNQADIDKVVAVASADGWHSFRVAYWDGSAPNFAATLNTKGK